MLKGGVAGLFGELAGPLFLAGRIWKPTAAYATNGDLTRNTPAATPCRVQVNKASERMVRDPGYTASDRALYILRDGLDVTFDSDCLIAVDDGPYAGTIWKIAAPIDGDPAAAYWLCRGVQQKAAPA